MRIPIALTALALILSVFGNPAAGADAAVKPPPTDQASLYARLDADYHRLLALDNHPEPIRQAEALLDQTKQPSHWTNFFKAVELIRKHRSLASVPLLMKYMVEDAATGSGHIAIPLYVDTIRILTGANVDSPDIQGRDRQAVALDAVLQIYSGWWQPNENHLTVDLGKMSDDNLKLVAQELLQLSDKELNLHSGGSGQAVSIQRQFEGLLTSLEEESMRRDWFPEDLHPRMTRLFLEDAGYVAKPTDDPTAGPGEVDFAAVQLLGVLNRSGGAPKLQDIANDPKQNDATRLTCMLALHAAGKDLHSVALLSILGADKRADVRVLSLLMLPLAGNNRMVGPKLLKALDDDDSEIRDAALYSIQKIDPRSALPKLTKVLHDGQPEDLIDPGLRLLAGIGGDTASALLADYLQKTIDSGDRNKIYRALYAFSTCTGQNWVEPGAHPQAYYEQQAHDAIAWWRARHPAK